MSNKAYLEFEGFNEAIARLNKLNANTKNISEKSLKKTHEIITKKAQEALDHASEAAVMLGHSYIGSEHLLIGLIQTEECLASAVLAEYDVTDEKIINLVYQLIAPEGAVGVKEPTGYTPRVRRILENSAKEAIRFKADLIGTEHILISIIKESECVAARLLNTIGVNIKKLYVDILIAMGEDANSYKEDFHSKTKKGKTSTQTLDQYSSCLLYTSPSPRDA